MLVYLGIGTNLGNRLENLQTALEMLPEEIKFLSTSSIYETPPWGYEDQPAFLNQVLEVETVLPPLELLKCLKTIEENLGRQPTFRYGPRLIDLDILYYGDQVIELSELTIPHPNLHQRAFVLVPLMDLNPDLPHPLLRKTTHEMLRELDAHEIKIYKETAEMKKTMPDLAAKTYLMGILNITPDSFSGDGVLQWADMIAASLELAVRFVNAGVDIIDIGGESTRPGARLVSAEDEQKRVLPVIKAIRDMGLDVAISIDTYKAPVARAAFEAGVDWINDVWGLRADPDLAQVAAECGCPLVLMHNRSKPVNAEIEARLGGRYVDMTYQDLIEDVKAELLESVEIARKAGVRSENIILDPGIGFGKTIEQNLELLNRLDEIKALGFPVLLGASRKSFIGYTLDLPANQRVEGTAAAVAVGIVRGANIVRVHDVEEMARVVRMTDAILGKGK